MSVLSYTEDIPNPPNIPAQDVPNMKANTNSLFSIWTRDHVGFNASFMGAVSGQHLQVTFNTTTSQSAPTNPASILYTFLDAASNPQLKFLNSGNSNQYNVGTNGSTTLFGGIIIKWGLGQVTTATNPKTFSYSVDFGLSNFPQNGFIVVAVPDDSSAPNAVNSAVYGYSPTASGFTVSATKRVTTGASSGNTNFFFIAIGN